MITSLLQSQSIHTPLQPAIKATSVQPVSFARPCVLATAPLQFIFDDVLVVTHWIHCHCIPCISCMVLYVIFSVKQCVQLSYIIHCFLILTILTANLDLILTHSFISIIHLFSHYCFYFFQFGHEPLLRQYVSLSWEMLDVVPVCNIMHYPLQTATIVVLI